MLLTRKKLWFFHLIGLGAFSATLVTTSPALAPEAIGFSVVYLAIAGLGFLLRVDRIGSAAMLLMAFVSFLIIGAAGGPQWALVAAALSVVTWWPRKLGVRV